MAAPGSGSFGSGVSAAVFAPFLMVLGFMIWDDHWTKKDGSAFSLNMFKCNLAAAWFLVVVVATHCAGEENKNPSLLFSSQNPRNGTLAGGVLEAIGAKIDPFRNDDVWYLYASSAVGILIGDWTWIEGLKHLGARRVIVMDSLKPFLASFAGWLFFGETFRDPILASIGLVLTVAGVALVGFEMETEKEREHDPEDGGPMDATAQTTEDGGRRAAARASHRYGIFVAMSNVVLHTMGASLTKNFGAGMSTWEINLVRFGFSGLCMLALSVSLGLRDRFVRSAARGPPLRHRGFLRSDPAAPPPGPAYGSVPAETKAVAPLRSPARPRADRGARWYELPELSRDSWVRVSLGVAFVSFLFPALTNYAMFQIPLGLLLTLESIGPLYSLPLTLMMHKECPSFRASIGAVFAVAGIVLLFLQGRADE